MKGLTATRIRAISPQYLLLRNVSDPNHQFPLKLKRYRVKNIQSLDSNNMAPMSRGCSL